MLSKWLEACLIFMLSKWLEACLIFDAEQLARGMFDF